MTVKTAVIIGGSRGIGRATALAFAQKGYQVVLTYKESRSDPEEVLSDLKNESIAHTVQLDVSNEDNLRSFSKLLDEEFGAIDVLVCNAGSIPRQGGWPNTNFGTWRQAWESNIAGHIILSQLCEASLRRSSASSIVFVGSVYATLGAAPVIEYAAAKAGVESAVASLSRALAPTIRVNAVIPGNVETDMTRAAGEELIRQIVDATPLRRLGQPEEIAGAIVFLASSAASFITGESLVIDGGFRWK